MDTPKDEPITDVEIPDAPTIDEGAPEVDIPPTLNDLAKGGMTPGEIEMAKGQGVIGKTPAEEAARKADAEKAAAEAAAKGEPDGKKKTSEEETVDSRFRILSEGKSPEQIIAEIGEKGTLSKEQETVLLASLTKNGQSMYWAQKKERQKRQKAESDLLTDRDAKQKEIDDLKAQLAARPTKGAEDDLDALGDETPEERAAREAALLVDPKKRPLTIEDLERIDKEKADKLAEEQRLRSERANEIREALNFQQEDAKTRYDDFDEATEKVGDILKAANAGTLDKIYPDPKDRSRVFQKCRDLLLAYAKADQFQEGDFNAADMTYELAKEHPDFGDEPRNNAPKKSETGADGTPESAKRVVTNATRRGSSATLNGGGSRRIPLEELTPEQARRLPTSKWNKLPKATREKLLGKV